MQIAETLPVVGDGSGLTLLLRSAVLFLSSWDISRNILIFARQSGQPGAVRFLFCVISSVNG